MSTRKCGCVYADSRNTPAVRAGHELGGYLKEACDKHSKHGITEKEMSNHNDGGPAFPREDYQADDSPGQRGMSLRDYFAAKAMQGIYACPTSVREPDGSDGPDILTDADIARLAYSMADAMLAARKGKV